VLSRLPAGAAGGYFGAWRCSHKKIQRTKNKKPKRTSSKQQSTMANKNDDDATKTVITLKGSVKIVADFFFTAINSILYQRGT